MIQSAYFANPENTAIVAATTDRGSVLLSVDDPEWDTASAIATPYTPPPPPPDWLAFRRTLATSPAYLAVAINAATTPPNIVKLMAINAAIVSPDLAPEFLVSLWNDLPLTPLTATPTHLTDLQTLITQHHIPLTLNPDGTLEISDQ